MAPARGRQTPRRTAPTRVIEAASTEDAPHRVRSLPATQAEVVLLRVVAGLPVAEVAELLGRSPGAVRVACHRGLENLARVPAKKAVTDSDLRSLRGTRATTRQ